MKVPLTMSKNNKNKMVQSQSYSYHYWLGQVSIRTNGRKRLTK